MKRRFLGCIVLSMFAATALAQESSSSNVPKRIQPRNTPAPSRLSAPAAPTPAPAPAPEPRPSVAAESQQHVTPLAAPEAMTPELYVYLQDQKRHDDPLQAIRRKAEFKASQRMNRMATMKWFGMSNARPQVAAVPMMGVYSPAWVGNGYDRYDWVGGAYPSANIYIEAETIQR